jgi:hypothetical protein
MPAHPIQPILVAALASAFVLSLVQSSASADEPTIADCLASNEAAIKAGNEHKLRAERAQFLLCASESCPADIRKACTGHVQAVNAEVPTIIFTAKDAAGADLTDVKVTMDGELLTTRLDGTALSVDPGSHRFTLEAQGKPTVTKTLLIEQGQKDRREDVALEPLAALVAATLVAASQPAANDHGLSTQKILAITAGGVGIVGLGIGAAFGIIALSDRSTAETDCGGTGACKQMAGVTEWGSVQSAGNVSTVAFVAGGVVIASGALLWITAPHHPAATQVGVTANGLLLKGSF